MNLKQKMTLVPGLTLAMMVVLFFVVTHLYNTVDKKVVYPQFRESVLGGSRSAIKSAVEIGVDVLAEALQGVTDPAERDAIIYRYTEPIRFFDDESGYLFAYTLKGIRINVPPLGTETNGKDMSNLQDSHGNYLVQGLADASRGDGSFYTYYFEKPGAGVQPKLSFAKVIPGTDVFIGAGVYIDNVDAETAALQKTVVEQKTRYSMIASGLFAAILVVSLVLTFVLARSVVTPVRKIVEKLISGAEQVASASGLVASASQSLAEGSTEQAASLEETSSSLEEMTSMTKQSAANAQQANSLSMRAQNAAEEGSSSMEKMRSAINDIQASASETAKIIKVIDEIAFQTNLLALNAAVEAARAGEAGKGFAVVAEEVRNLAKRSAEAARNTSDLIEGSVRNAHNGVEITGEVGKSLGDIVNNITQTSSLVSEIAAAADEQAQGIGQINTAISQMDQVTQANAANAEESASASGELNSQAEQMTSIVGELRLIVDGNRGRSVQASTPRRPPSRNTVPEHSKAIPFDEDLKDF